MKIDQPHLSVNPDTLNSLIEEPTKNLKFLKDQMQFLNEHLTDDEKSDELIAAKLTALEQKISRLEKMIKQISNIYTKETQEVQSLLDSFEPIDCD